MEQDIGPSPHPPEPQSASPAPAIPHLSQPETAAPNNTENWLKCGGIGGATFLASSLALFGASLIYRRFSSRTQNDIEMGIHNNDIEMGVPSNNIESDLVGGHDADYSKLSLRQTSELIRSGVSWNLVGNPGEGKSVAVRLNEVTSPAQPIETALERPASPTALERPASGLGRIIASIKTCLFFGNSALNSNQPQPNPQQPQLRSALNSDQSQPEYLVSASAPFYSEPIEVMSSMQNPQEARPSSTLRNQQATNIYSSSLTSSTRQNFISI
jgi:hypothetical protein